jgi:hypothetical protein
LERKILKTKAIYSRLTIDQLVAKLATSRPKTTEEVIAKLQDMVSYVRLTLGLAKLQITSGKIQATISDSSPAIVTFADDVPAAPHTAINQISRLNGMASLLQQHLAQSSREIGLNPKYLQKVSLPRLKEYTLTR